MRTLVIGDLHGCLDALDALLAAIIPKTNDCLIFLGDYIDRGPNSSGVIKRMLTLKKRVNTICLLGNHEQMILGSRTNTLLHREWMANGGDMTLRSYGSPSCTIKDIPPEHWDFFSSCQLYHETNTHIFVHAGVDPQLAMKDQPDYILLWERYNDPLPHMSGKTVVCGHTPAKTVRSNRHAICIDTAAFKHDGCLTCLDIGAGYLYHATQKGKVTFSLLADVRS